MNYEALNFTEKPGLSDDRWAPRVIAEMEVVPRGKAHRPRAACEVEALSIEPRGVVDAGAGGGELATAGDVRI